MTLSQKYLKTLLDRIDGLLEQRPAPGFLGEEIEILTTVVTLLEKINNLVQSDIFTMSDFSEIFSKEKFNAELCGINFDPSETSAKDQPEPVSHPENCQQSDKEPSETFLQEDRAQVLSMILPYFPKSAQIVLPFPGFSLSVSSTALFRASKILLDQNPIDS